MSDIPSDLLREILIRLPAESLLPLRSVCKQWLQTIDGPDFIKAHTKTHLNSHTLLLENGVEAPLYSFSLDSLNFANGPQTVHAGRVEKTARVDLRGVSTWAACNGLFMHGNTDAGEKWVIWNPSTKEIREVGVRKPPPCCFGFGYRDDSDDYRVVRIDEVGKNEWGAFVYSLKSCSWRSIGGCPRSISGSCKRGTYVNGAIYWWSRDAITALDLGTESFCQLALPPVGGLKFGGLSEFNLDALDGCLIFSLDDMLGEKCNGWVMEDNGFEKSWIKLFSLEYSYPLVMVSSLRLRVVAYLKRKQQIVFQLDRVASPDDQGFLWFDIRTNSVKKFSLCGISGIISCKICPGSLVRLNARDCVVEPGDLRKRNRETERIVTRLKFCVRDTGEMCYSNNSSCSASKCLHCRDEEE